MTARTLMMTMFGAFLLTACTPSEGAGVRDDPPASAGVVAAAAPAPSEDGPMCSLSPGQLQERMALARDLVSRSLVGWRKVAGDGTLLRLRAAGVEDAVRLVMLERRCCAGVGATLELGIDREDADLVLRGPAGFQQEVASLLKAAPKLAE